MALNKCFVRDCLTSTTESFKLYYFPVDPARKRKWIQFCGQDTEPSKNHGVCRRHFKEEDFLLSARVLGRDERTWRLMRTAVPSLHGHGPVSGSDSEDQVVQEVEEEVVIEIEEVSDPMRLCRLCLNPLQDTDDKAQNLFNGEAGIKKSIEQLFQLILEDAPNWPGVACGACVENFEQMAYFKRRIIDSHAFFHDRIVQEKSRPQPGFLDSLSLYEAGLQKKMLSFAQQMHYFDCAVPSCGHVSATFESFIDHQKQHNHNGYISCCGVKRQMTTRLLEHLTDHVDNSDTACVVCRQDYYGDWDALYAHLYASHQDLQKIPLKCRDCDKIMANRVALRNHRLTHIPKELRPHACPHCPQRYAVKANLDRHIMRIHDVKVRVICDTCGKGFPDNGNYSAHRKTCLVYALQSDLGGVGKKRLRGGFKAYEKRKIAVDSKRPEEMQDPVNCPVCAAVVDRVDMRVHSIKHVDNPANTMFCEICLIRMKGSASFQTHMDRHRGRKYKCEFCPGVEYDNHASYYCHMRTQHREEMERRRKKKLEDRKADDV